MTPVALTYIALRILELMTIAVYSYVAYMALHAAFAGTAPRAGTHARHLLTIHRRSESSI